MCSAHTAFWALLLKWSVRGTGHTVHICHLQVTRRWQGESLFSFRGRGHSEASRCSWCQDVHEAQDGVACLDAGTAPPARPLAAQGLREYALSE